VGPRRKTAGEAATKIASRQKSGEDISNCPCTGKKHFLPTPDHQTERSKITGGEAGKFRARRSGYA